MRRCGAGAPASGGYQRSVHVSVAITKSSLLVDTPNSSPPGLPGCHTTASPPGARYETNAILPMHGASSCRSDTGGRV